MKIIIAHVSAGAGHRKAADAIYSYFKTQNQDFDVRIVDVLEKSNPFFRSIYICGYSFLVNHALFLWSFAFWITQKKPGWGFFQKLNILIDRLNSPLFFSLLIRENPDFVISTHFLPSEITGYLKNRQKIQSKLITVITDFGLHPFWLCEGTDMYAVASELTARKLQDHGVPSERIKVTGIPVSVLFSQRFDKAEICAKLGIAPDKFTVLAVTGSFGIGPIEEITALLHKDVQMLVVCARNNKLFSRLKAKRYPDVKIFGFINNIEELMRICDIIITKPGGLIVSELLAMELVPVFICAIPGQETENAKTLAGYGVGISSSRPFEVRQIVLDYKNRPDKILKVKEIIKAIKRPNAVGDLYDVICQSSTGAANRRPV